MEGSFPMTGGDGPNSYAVNSQKQKIGAEMTKAMLIDTILENIDTERFTSGQFTIADLGCSTGPNTFITVENIIQGLIQKFKTHQGLFCNLEFQVFFNDHTGNDFNTLFSNLPLKKPYFAAGTPGSFYGRLFPESSISFFNSSFSLQWLSKPPENLIDVNSPAFNKGRIFYGNAPNEVAVAYSAQFAEDMEVFLDSRAKELVPGGLMSILMPGRPEGTLASQASLGPFFEPLESCLRDLTDEGILSMDKIDSFNVPIYSPSIDELRTLIHKNGHFSILTLNLLSVQPSDTSSAITASECRAGFQTLFTSHFGKHMADLVFDRYSHKFRHIEIDAHRLSGVLFIILKRSY